jgi:putative SOS response-associated peptidase YedK
MCGRIDLHTPPAQLARLLEVQLAQGVDPEGEPSWNVAPTRRLYAVIESRRHSEGNQIEGTVRLLDQFRWGFVPYWAKDVRVGNRMINARAETLATAPAYRSAFATHRCLIAVDGFYEWRVPDPSASKAKVPFYFSGSDGRPLLLAGLYSTWWDKTRSARPDPETLLRTCTVITTDAGADLADVHDRMPAIMSPDVMGTWLDRDFHDPATLGRLLRPAPGGTLLRREVSTEVNDPRHDGPQLLAAVS